MLNWVGLSFVLIARGPAVAEHCFSNRTSWSSSEDQCLSSLRFSADFPIDAWLISFIQQQRSFSLCFGEHRRERKRGRTITIISGVHQYFGPSTTNSSHSARKRKMARKMSDYPRSSRRAERSDLVPRWRTYGGELGALRRVVHYRGIQKKKVRYGRKVALVH